MIKGIAVTAVLAVVCAVLTATPAVAGEKAHTIRICTPGDETHELKVKVDVEETGWLGVSIQDVDEKLRKKLDLGDDVVGVFISDVHEDSPAEKAGLLDGDIIIAVSGEDSHTVSKLGDLIRSKEPGTEAEVVVLRDGKQKKVYAILGSSPVMVSTVGHGELMEGLLGLKSLEALTIPGLSWVDIGISGASGRGRLGVYIDDLSEGMAEFLEVPDGEGALVEDVVEDSPAEKAGIKAGDVIVKIGDHDVDDVEELVEAIGKMEADVETPVTVYRKGRELVLNATVGESEYEKAIKEYKKAVKLHADEIGEKAIYIKQMEGELEKEALEEELEELREALEELKEELKELKD